MNKENSFLIYGYIFAWDFWVLAATRISCTALLIYNGLKVEKNLVLAETLVKFLSSFLFVLPGLPRSLLALFVEFSEEPSCEFEI